MMRLRIIFLSASLFPPGLAEGRDAKRKITHDGLPFFCRLRAADGELPECLHPAATGWTIGRAATVALPPMPPSHRRPRQRSAAKLDPPGSKVPGLRRKYFLALSRYRIGHLHPVCRVLPALPGLDGRLLGAALLPAARPGGHGRRNPAAARLVYSSRAAAGWCFEPLKAARGRPDEHC